jgi:hypothetical protein
MPYFNSTKILGDLKVTGLTSLEDLSIDDLTIRGQLISSLSAGTAPFIISSTTRVSNLNVDRAGYADLIATAQKSDNINYQIPFVTSVTAGNQNLYTDSATQITYNPNTNTLVVPNITATLSGSATSLANTRTLWGQNFNGTANVIGDMTSVGNITMGTQINKATITYPTNVARTYTIPNAGENANFVMTEGNQTINGTKIFSDLIVGDSGDANWEMDGTIASVFFVKDNGGIPRLTVYNSGQVGIGTVDTNGYMLRVDGTSHITGTLKTGAYTIPNSLSYYGSDVTADSQTLNIATAATASDKTKTLNLATGSDIGSTTNVNIGSSAGGTTSIDSPTTNISGELVVGGNLTVNGTTTTINSTVKVLNDPIMSLGGTGTISSNDGKDRGIQFNHYDTAQRTGFFGYDNSLARFIMVPQATISSEVISGNTGIARFASLELGNLTGNIGTLQTASLTAARTYTLPNATGDIALTSNIGDGTLSWATPDASNTNTTVIGSLSGAYSANTSTNRTLKLSVGPALTNLATTMTGSNSGFITKTNQDTYTIDDTVYLAKVPLTVDTAAATVAKTSNETVTFTNGTLYMVRFVNGNTAASPTLNGVNIQLGNTNANTTVFSITGNIVIPMYYDVSTNTLQLTGSFRTSDTSETYVTRWNNSSIIMGEELTRTKIVMMSSDNKWYQLVTGNSTAANGKTINSIGFIVNSPIVYYGGTATVAAEASPVSTDLYSGASLGSNFAYNTNQISGWISHRPIYLKGTINSSGLLVLAGSGTTGTDYLTQTLPTTEDGFVYILLGMMYTTTTSFRLLNEHTVLEFKDGALRPYLPDHPHLPLTGGTLTGLTTISNSTYQNHLRLTRDALTVEITPTTTENGGISIGQEIATATNRLNWTHNGTARNLYVGGTSGSDVIGRVYAAQYYIGTNRKDSNWDTGYSYSQIGHLPLSGGELTGLVSIAQNMTAGTTAAFTSPHLALKTANTTDSTGFVGMTFDTSTSANYGYSLGALRSSNGYGSLVTRWHYGNAQGSEVMRILNDASGSRIGIGTDNPIGTLDVQTSSGTALLRIRSATDTSPIASIELLRGANNTFGADAYNDWRISNNAGALNFDVGINTTTTTPMSLQSSGLLTLLGSISLTGASSVSTTTGNLTLSTSAGNGNILLEPHGTGIITHTKALASKGPNYTSTWMRFTEDQYGNALYLGSGGLTAIGGGESINEIIPNIGAGEEVMVFGSDNQTTATAFRFISSLQAGWAGKVEALTITGAGDATLAGNLVLTGASSVSSSTGNLTVQSSAGNGQLILSSHGTGAVSLDSGTTGGINIGTNANAKTITLGNSTGATGITLTTGTGGITSTSTATTGSAISLTSNSITSGKGLLIQSSGGATMTGSLLEVLGNGGITTGDLAKFSSTGYAGSAASGMVDIISSSTARVTNSSLLFINSTGNVNSVITKGAYISAANAGSGATSIALELNATGTNATALNVVAGGTNLQALSGTSAVFSSGVTANTLTSTVATGTAPLVVASTTKVTNLNADLFDGIDSANFIYGQNGSGTNSAPATWAQTHVTQYKSGFWDTSGASWTPDTGWWWGMTLAHVSNTASYLFGAQMAFSNSLNPDFRYRGMSGGASGATGVWKTVINAEDNQTITGTKTFTAPRLASGSFIADSNGNELINFPTAVTNAVNELYISNAATGNAVSISTTGGDTNIGLSIGTKGSGAIALNSNTNITGNTVVSGSTTSTSFKTANWTIEQHGTTSALVFNFA